MKLGYLPTLENNIRTMKVYVKSLGSSILTEAEEFAILNNYKPIIAYKDLVFSGKFNIDSDGNVISDEVGGELVTISLVNKEIEINKDFVATFSIASKSVLDSEIGTILNSKDKVAEAKCVLFKNVITKAVQDMIVAIKAKENGFETEGESVEF